MARRYSYDKTPGLNQNQKTEEGTGRRALKGLVEFQMRREGAESLRAVSRAPRTIREGLNPATRRQRRTQLAAHLRSVGARLQQSSLGA